MLKETYRRPRDQYYNPPLLHLLSQRLKLKADKEKVAESRIPAPDDHQLELLTEVRDRRAMSSPSGRHPGRGKFNHTRAVCLIVARYADNHQGPSRHFMWILELQMRALIIGIFALLAEDEIDGQLEAEIWCEVV